MIQNFLEYPYIANKKGFLVKDGDIRLFSVDNKLEIMSYYENRVKYIVGDEAKKLQNALNNFVNSQQENYNFLIDNFIIKLDNGLLSELNKLDGVVTRKGASFNLHAVTTYEKQIRELAEKYLGDKIKKDDNLSTIISRINGQLNILRGDIFENVLAYILDDSITIVDNKIQETESELLNNFVKKINNNNLSIHDLDIKKTKVSGQERKDNIQINIGSDTITINGAQGKTDVKVPDLDGNMRGISAKSYTSSRRIHLVTKANLAGLIAQWPIGDEEKNLAINAFTAPSEIARQYNISKSIFLLQSLSGVETDDVLSELFIINRNTPENPFIVFSMYDLIFNDSFKGKFSQIHSLKAPRKEKDFYNYIRSTTISISTQLTLSNLAKQAGL